jgi:hypothetical protein
MNYMSIYLVDIRQDAAIQQDIMPGKIIAEFARVDSFQLLGIGNTHEVSVMSLSPGCKPLSRHCKTGREGSSKTLQWHAVS